MEGITRHNMVEKLFEHLPELRSAMDEMVAYLNNENPGSHIVYGDVLNPHIDKLLDERGSDKKLKQIFDFLEILSNNEDVHIQEVVVVSVLEHFDKEALEKVRPYMGPTTLHFLSEMEKFRDRMTRDYREKVRFRDVLRMIFGRVD